MTAGTRTARSPRIRNALQWLVLVLGLAAVVSTWFSIGASTEDQYREMLASDAANPGTVSSEEWIDSEMDALPKLLGLFLLGVPAFIVVTCSVAGIAASCGQRKWIWLLVGLAWIFLGGLLHLMVWKL